MILTNKKAIPDIGIASKFTFIIIIFLLLRLLY